MPPDYRNSVGFLGLQLRANKLQQEQQQAIAQQAFDREAKQQDITNAMSMAKQNLAGLDAAENRKLQLAGMLQKAKESADTRLALEGMKESYGKDLQGAKTEKEKSITAKNNATTTDIPLDTAETGRHNLASEANTVRGQDLGVYGNIAGKFATPDVSGRRELQLDPSFLDSMQWALQHPNTNAPAPAPSSAPDAAPLPAQHTLTSLGLKQAPPRDPNVQPLPLKDIAKTALEANSIGKGADRLDELYTTADQNFDASNFGLTGSAVGINALKDLAAKGQTLVGKEGTDLQKGSASRAAFKSGIGLEMAQTVRDFSGAQSAEPEAKRLGATTGIAPADFDLLGKGELDPFSMDKPVFLKVLRAAIDWKRSKAANAEQIVRDQGVRIGPPSAAGGGRREPPASPVDINFNSDQATAPPLNLPPRRRKTNPATGETREWDGKRWVPIQ